MAAKPDWTRVGGEWKGRTETCSLDVSLEARKGRALHGLPGSRPVPVPPRPPGSHLPQAPTSRRSAAR